MRILRHKPKPFKAIGIKRRDPWLARNNLQFHYSRQRKPHQPLSLSIGQNLRLCVFFGFTRIF
jgi:hypothetical protein